MSRPWRWYNHEESQTKNCPNCTNKSTSTPNLDLYPPLKPHTTNVWPEIVNQGDYLEDIEEDENHPLSKPFDSPSVPFCQGYHFSPFPALCMQSPSHAQTAPVFGWNLPDCNSQLSAVCSCCGDSATWAICVDGDCDSFVSASFLLSLEWMLMA